MNCPKCGSPVMQDDRFCGECGEKLMQSKGNTTAVETTNNEKLRNLKVL